MTKPESLGHVSALTDPLRSSPRLRERCRGWWRRMAEILPRPLAARSQSAGVRIFAAESLPATQIEAIRRMASRLVPEALPVKIYILQDEPGALCELTCCVAAEGCESMRFDRSLLGGAEREKLAQKMKELIYKCLPSPRPE